MSDYEALEVGLNDLGKYEAEHEASGYDAVTTTQQGLRQDEFMKDSGLSIDMIGDAEIAQEKEEKEKKKANDLTEAFYRAVRDEQMMKIGDHEISRGDLRMALSDYDKILDKRLKDAKTPEETAQILLAQERLKEVMERYTNGTETDADRQYLEDLEKEDADFNGLLTEQEYGFKNIPEKASLIVADRASDISKGLLTDSYNLSATELEMEIESFNDITILISQTNNVQISDSQDNIEAPHKANNNTDFNMNDFGMV